MRRHHRDGLVDPPMGAPDLIDGIDDLAHAAARLARILAAGDEGRILRRRRALARNAANTRTGGGRLIIAGLRDSAHNKNYQRYNRKPPWPPHPRSSNHFDSPAPLIAPPTGTCPRKSTLSQGSIANQGRDGMAPSAVPGKSGPPCFGHCKTPPLSTAPGTMPRQY